MRLLKHFIILLLCLLCSVVSLADDNSTMPASNVVVTETLSKSVTQTEYTITSSSGTLSGSSSSGGPGQQNTYYNTWTSSTTSPTTLTLKSYSDSGCGTATARISGSLGLYAKTQSQGGPGQSSSSTSTSYFQLAVGNGYQIVSYNITYSATNATASVTSDATNTVNSQTATFSVTSSSSSSGGGPGGGGYSNSSYITPSTFTVIAAPVQYTITYDGCDDATNPNPTTYTIEDEIMLASPSKSGYTFAGWTNSSGTVVTSISKGSTGDITLTANWTKPSYTISCTSTIGGTVTADPTAANENDVVALTITPNSGYELSSLSVKDTSDNDVIVSNNTFTMPASNVTVTATFTPITYTITYNLDGGANAETNPATYTVESETITLADPTKEDYNFTGWTNASGTKVTSIAKGSTGDLTLTANWTEKTYAITCGEAENGSVSVNPSIAAKGATVTITATPDEGYVLSSLSVTDANSATVETTKSDDGTYTFVMPSTTVTVSATFSEIRLDITDSAPDLIAGTYKAGNVTYSRTGSYVIDGNYSSFCLPFDFNVADAPCFNKVYIPIDVAFYNTSTEKLKIFLVNQSGIIEAGTPFIGRLTGEAISLKNASSVVYDGSVTNPDEIELTVFDNDGSSSVLTSDETIKLYWGGTLKSTPNKDGMNTFNLDGSFGPRTTTSNLSPFRAYLIEIYQTDSAKSYDLEVLFLDEDPTGILELTNSDIQNVDVCGINGIILRRNVNLQHALDGLQSGLYIVNGKKILKK